MAVEWSAAYTSEEFPLRAPARRGDIRWCQRGRQLTLTIGLRTQDVYEQSTTRRRLIFILCGACRA